MKEANKLSIETIIDRDHKVYMNTFGQRVPLCLSHGEGCHVYDHEGNRYLDLIGGIAVNVLGHAHPNLTRALQKQAGKLLHCSNYYYNLPQLELCEKLSARFGDGRVFLSNSGAEANEAAIKLARGYFYKRESPRAKIVTARQSFHGRTLTTITATGQPQMSAPFAPLPSGFVHVPFNDLAAMEQAIDDQTCAVMLEVIQGESGVWPATQKYLQGVQKLCLEHGARLIIDEIQTGMGRTGHFFASELYGIKPDIITLAKGLGGGVPIGATLATPETASGFKPGDHGTTFGGNPLACAAANAVLDTYEEENLVEKAKTTGKTFLDQLRKLAETHESIRDLRGAGLMIGIEIADADAADVKLQLMRQGYLVGSVGSSTLRLLPPLILPEAEIKPFVHALAATLS